MGQFTASFVVSCPDLEISVVKTSCKYSEDKQLLPFSVPVHFNQTT